MNRFIRLEKPLFTNSWNRNFINLTPWIAISDNDVYLELLIGWLYFTVAFSALKNTNHPSYRKKFPQRWAELKEWEEFYKNF